jgi:hypothetical protein
MASPFLASALDGDEWSVRICDGEATCPRDKVHPHTRVAYPRDVEIISKFYLTRPSVPKKERQKCGVV